MKELLWESRLDDEGVDREEDAVESTAEAVGGRNFLSVEYLFAEMPPSVAS
jgi:hypothetical protein